MLEAGKPASEIASQLGITTSGVYYHTAKAKRQAKRGPKKPPASKALARAPKALARAGDVAGVYSRMPPSLSMESVALIMMAGSLAKKLTRSCQREPTPVEHLLLAAIGLGEIDEAPPTPN